MITAKLLGVLYPATLGATAAAVTASVAPVAPIGKGMYDLGGVIIPVIPVAVGVLTALLVRLINIFSKPNPAAKISYNVLVTLLAMVGAATFITDHKIGVGTAFWVGGSFGALGIGILSIMRSPMMASIISAVRDAIAVKPKHDPEVPPPPA